MSGKLFSLVVLVYLNIGFWGNVLGCSSMDSEAAGIVYFVLVALVWTAYLAREGWKSQR